MKSLGFVIFAFFGSLFAFTLNPLLGIIFVGWIVYKSTAMGEEKNAKKAVRRAPGQRVHRAPVQQVYYEQPVVRYEPQYEESRYQEPRYEEPAYRDPEENCPYKCSYGTRDCPRCNGRGAGMFDSYDVCPECNDTGDVTCYHGLGR